jgi:serine/threonine-protein kinase
LKGYLIGGRYCLQRHLGSGAVGEVWAAEDFLNGKQVAVKVLHAHHRKSSRVYERFVREAAIMRKFSHPRIVQLIDSLEEAETAFLVMEYVEGESLHTTIRERSQRHEHFEWSEIRGVVGDVAAGVTAAHAQSILHRDLKPGNVLLLEEGGRTRAKVADFGIAKMLEGPAHDGTTVGRVVGTPRYMAPEQCEARAVDDRADQFALGVLAFEMVTLVSPWDDVAYHTRTDVEPVVIMGRVMTAERPLCSEKRADIPEELDAIVAKAMAIEPQDRYATTAEFSQAFARAIAAYETLRQLPHAPLKQIERHRETQVVRQRTTQVTLKKSSKLPLFAALSLVVVGAAIAASRATERAMIEHPILETPSETIEAPLPTAQQKPQLLETARVEAETQEAEIEEAEIEEASKTKRVRKEPVEAAAPKEQVREAKPDLLASARLLVQRSASEPNNSALLEQLDRELTRITHAVITDEDLKKQLIRSIKASAFAGNVGGLERALKDLDDAIDRGGTR